MEYDVIIIGSGPAGLTAGIYLARFKRNVLIIDGEMPGGQLMTTSEVENWPGELSIQGPDLIKKMREQAEICGSKFLGDVVTRVDFSQRPFIVETKNKGELLTKSVIVATGSSPKRLGCPGEDEYWGKGVNTCATCDAPLYAGKEVVVVGGGNSAVSEAYALSRHAKDVTILQLLDKLTATDPIKNKALEAENVEVMCNKKVVEIKGDGEKVSSVVIEDTKDGSRTGLATDGVFIAVGMIPNTALFKDQLELNEQGYIKWQCGVKTSREGVFVAGDAADKLYRQAITASGYGCAAAIDAERFLT